MKKDDYISAIIELLYDKKDFADVISNLKTVLEKKGHQRLLKKILLGLLKNIENSTKTSVAVVSVARNTDIDLLKDKINKSLTEIDSKDYEVKVEPSLIGGYALEYNNKIIDNSYKARLVTLYRSLLIE